MPDSWTCRDCPPGNVITDHVYRVQKRTLHRDEKERIVAADVIEQFDVYCKSHYEARKRAEML